MAQLCPRESGESLTCAFSVMSYLHFGELFLIKQKNPFEMLQRNEILNWLRNMDKPTPKDVPFWYPPNPTALRRNSSSAPATSFICHKWSHSDKDPLQQNYLGRSLLPCGVARSLSSMWYTSDDLPLPVLWTCRCRNHSFQMWSMGKIITCSAFWNIREHQKKMWILNT